MEINFNLFFRSSLPKLSDLPNHLGKLITDGISINSSYSTDVEPPKPGQDLPTQIGNIIFHSQSFHSDLSAMF